jgi:hypothetical protein
MTNPEPVLAIAEAFALMVGQDPSERRPSSPWEVETDLLISAYGADAFMARARISGAIELNGEVVELRRGRTALWVGHEIVRNFPHLFSIPALPEREPDPPAPAPGLVCWTDGLRDRPHWTLGRRHGDRRRRWFMTPS